MGTTHIFFLYDDALAPARDSPVDPQTRDALALDLGRALLDLAIDPEYLPDDKNNPMRVTWRRVGTHGNALQWCDEVHNDELRVYVWVGNCLRDLGELDDSVKREVCKLFEHVCATRVIRR